jgi:DNA-binding beta-propeller fold protein YncE
MKIVDFRRAPMLAFTGALLAGYFIAPVLTAQSGKRTVKEVPVFSVDPSWPKIPNNWVFGEVSSVAVDAQNHIWVLQRPRTLRPADKSHAAPPVVVFDVDGNYVKSWGGPGAGYEWPATEHGIFVDYKNNVWIGGNEPKLDDQILKFTSDGKFLMQIGHSGQSKGNSDTQNLNRPADQFVYPKTNELFVADGYGNSRVIVFDADTGAFKRMWGAFGKEPKDTPASAEGAPAEGGEKASSDKAKASGKGDPGPPQFKIVHAARVSDDGLVYVSDRGNKRLQVFTLNGKFLKQTFIGRDCEAPACGNGQTTAATAFSRDPGQRYVFVADRSEGHVLVLDRKSLEVLYSFGNASQAPGDFNILHHMAVDLKGNLYTTEVNDNFARGECCRRIQKFVYKGMSAPPSN